MAASVELLTTPTGTPAGTGAARARGAGRLGHGKRTRSAGRLHLPGIAVLVMAMVLFFTPLIASAIFGFTLPGVGLTFASLSQAFSNPMAVQAVTMTVLLGLLTTAASLALLVPTIVYLHLKAPRAAKLAEALSVIPIVVPAVALVAGAGVFFRAVAPGFLVSPYALVPFYVIITMPLVYRALDAGLTALHLRTLFAAAASLGASPWRTLIGIVLPNMRAALLSAGLLCMAMVLGEFALASLLLQYTFPVFLVETGAAAPRGAAALSFVTMLATWGLLALISLISAAGNRRRRTPSATPSVTSTAKEQP